MASSFGSSLLVHQRRTICRTIFCSSVKSNMVSFLARGYARLRLALASAQGGSRGASRLTRLDRHDSVLARRPLDHPVPAHLDRQAEHVAGVARIDDVVDQAPAGDLVD